MIDAHSDLSSISTEELQRFAAEGQVRLAARAAKNDFLEFIRFTMPDPEFYDDYTKSLYEITPVARLLADVLQKVERGELLRVAVSIGPQFGKSEPISRRFPAWYMGRNPWKHFMLGTYNQDFAMEFGAEVRGITELGRFKKVFPQFRFKKGSEAKNLMVTDRGGKMAFIGVGGSGSGKPADVFIIDDPIKNDEDVQSEKFREGLWAWFNKVAYARAKTTTAIVIVHCLVGDTPVTMADGNRKQLAEVRPGDEVRAWDRQLGFVTKKVLNFTSQGVDDVIELKTGNHTVRGNARHPFLVARGGELNWLPLGSIGRGDQLVCSGAEPGAGRRLAAEQAWLLGFMFGDGWLTKRDAKNYDKVRGAHYPRRGIVTCCAQSKYPELNERVLAAFEAQFGLRPKPTKFGYWRTEKQIVGQWFDEHGLAGRAKTKCLPDWLFQETIEVRRAFLRGFSEADGHCNESTGTTTVAASNAELIGSLRHLARSVGVRASNLHVCEQTTQPPNSPKPIDSVIHSFSYGVSRLDGPFDLVRVRSVEPVGRAEVFDIQVEGAENFIADGLVVHNTRWHEDDLIGRLCDPDHPERNKKYAGIADDWTYINIPAVVKEGALAEALDLKPVKQTDPLVVSQFGHDPICSLWEERKSIKHLASARRLDAPAFDSLYMGKPSPDDGDYFKVGNLVVHATPDEYPDKRDLRIYAASDHSLGSKNSNDYNVMGCFGVDKKNDIWILADLFWDRCDTGKLLDEMIALMKRHEPMIWFAEDEHINKSIGPFRRKRMREEEVFKTSVQGLTSAVDLKARARSIQGRTTQHMVHFPGWAPWWSRAKAEMLKFPKATHDDFVSFLSLIGRGLDAEFPAVEEKPLAPVLRVGSIEWVKAASKRQANENKMRMGALG